MSIVRKGSMPSNRDGPKIVASSGKPPTNISNSKMAPAQGKSGNKPPNYLDRVISSVLYTNQNSKQNANTNQEAYNQYYNKKVNPNMQTKNSNPPSEQNSQSNRQNPNARTVRMPSGSSINKTYESNSDYRNNSPGIKNTNIRVPRRSNDNQANENDKSFNRASLSNSQVNVVNSNIRTVKSEMNQQNPNQQNGNYHGSSTPNILKEQSNEEFGETTRRKLEFGEQSRRNSIAEGSKNSNPETQIPKSNYKKNNLKVLKTSAENSRTSLKDVNSSRHGNNDNYFSNSNLNNNSIISANNSIDLEDRNPLRQSFGEVLNNSRAKLKTCNSLNRKMNNGNDNLSSSSLNKSKNKPVLHSLGVNGSPIRDQRMMLKNQTKHQRLDSKASQYSKNSGYNPLSVTFQENNNRNKVSNHMISTEINKSSNRNPNMSRDHSTDFGRQSSYNDLENTPQHNGMKNLTNKNQVASEFKATPNLCGFPGFHRNSNTENKKFDIQTYINEKKQRIPNDNNKSLNELNSVSSSKRLGHRNSTAITYQQSPARADSIEKMQTLLKDTCFYKTENVTNHKINTRLLYDDANSNDLPLNQSGVTYTQAMECKIAELMKGMEYYEKQNISLFYKIKALKSINKNFNMHNDANKYLNGYMSCLGGIKQKLIKDIDEKARDLEAYTLANEQMKLNNISNKEYIDAIKVKHNLYNEYKDTTKNLNSQVSMYKEKIMDQERDRHIILSQLMQNFEKDKRTFADMALMKIAYELAWKNDDQEIQR